MATNPLVIPQEERYSGLKEILTGYVAQTVQLREKHPEFAQQQLPFLAAVFPWFSDENKNIDLVQQDWLTRRKIELEAVGFDGNTAKETLTKILENDRHLRECCPTPLHLAQYLDQFFITETIELKSRGVDQRLLDYVFEEFESTTYHQGRFKRVALSHLFNFDMDGNSASFGDVRIERIHESTIPQILGESGYQAFLHPGGVGNCFIVAEEEWDERADYPWLANKHVKALTFAQVLQYFKDGIIHIGYSVPYFQPAWVNQIRRTGLFFLGNPRRDPYEGGKKPYFMKDNERVDVTKWWTAVTSPAIAGKLADTTTKLRQAILRAGTYYEARHERPSPTERLIPLAIALESMFSPSDKGELTFRISLSAAQFIGRTAEERHAIFKGVKDMYGRRSDLFHGSYDLDKYNNGAFVTAAEIETWMSWIRRSLTGFIALYLTGHTDRNEILKDIVAASLDPAVAEKLRNSSQLDKVLVA